jgi:hypothetical protein
VLSPPNVIDPYTSHGEGETDSASAGGGGGGGGGGDMDVEVDMGGSVDSSYWAGPRTSCIQLTRSLRKRLVSSSTLEPIT